MKTTGKTEKMIKTIKVGAMEKRIAGITRWLERCLKACKSDALESALMDAECARADIELLRDDVWKKLEKRYAAKTRNWGVWLWLRLRPPAKAAFWAIIVVLAAATPVALFENAARNPLSLEWVTPDEKALLISLRKGLSDDNSFASGLPAEKRAEEPEEKTGPAKAATPARKPAEKPPVAQRPPSLEKDASETGGIPYDRILSLVQTGERAMKPRASIITIEKRP
jgi:hypothetical protein